METATFNAPVSVYPEGLGLALFPPFPVLEGHGALVCDQDLALTVRIRDLNRRFQLKLVGFRFLLDSGLACCRRRYRGASCS
jgi:hypothetical protein